MTQHTPGPWTARTASYGFDVFVSDAGSDRALWVASVTTGVLGRETPFYPPKQECAANAAAIAAIPVMLQALVTTAGNIRSLGPAGAIPRPYEAWLEVVDAAIAKAGDVASIHTE